MFQLAYLASLQFPKNASFDKGELSAMASLDNVLVT